MAFPRREYWSGLPFPPPGDIPDPGMELMSPALQVDSLPLSHGGNSQQDRTELINSLKGTGQLFTNLLLENTDIKKFFSTTHFHLSTFILHLQLPTSILRMLRIELKYCINAQWLYATLQIQLRKAILMPSPPI